VQVVDENVLYAQCLFPVLENGAGVEFLQVLYHVVAVVPFVEGRYPPFRVFVVIVVVFDVVVGPLVASHSFDLVRNDIVAFVLYDTT
jgi:hypothetical protein